jgi:DNA-binding CsgD family transcriptional regulator/MoxR-like ATPase
MRGREQEWLLVANLLRHVSQGAGGTLLVEGEPGIGKSLLLAEAASAASGGGCTVIAGTADELSRFLPGGPLLAALRESPSAVAGQAGRHRLAGTPASIVQAVQQRFERQARIGPVLVCLDDLQWADPVTLLVLRLLPLHLASYPISWILARSDAEDEGGTGMLFDVLAGEGAMRIGLLPLLDDDVAGLIADAVGAEPDTALLRLASGAAGNPSLITDLVAGLLDEDAITVEAGRARLGTEMVPQRMQTVVRSRFDRLGSRSRQLVQTAAVIGRSFRLEDAAFMMGTSAADLLPAVDEAISARVLVATQEALSFRHRLVWRAITDSLPPPVRQALHSQFGEIMLARGSALQAASHLIEAAYSDDPRSVARLDQALAEVRPESPAAAADLAVRALDLTEPEDTQRFSRSASAAEALADVGRLAEADRVIRDALAQPMPGRHQARLRCALAGVLHLRGLDAQATAEAEKILAEPGLPRRVRDRARIALLQTLAHGRDNRRGVGLAREIREAPEGHTREARVAALIVLAVIRWDEGRMADGLALCEEAVLLASQNPPDIRLPQARLTLAARLVDLRRFADAARLLRAVGEKSDAFADLEMTAGPALLRARMALAQGQLDDAVAEAQTACRIADALGAAACGEEASEVLTAVALRRGDLDGARALAAGQGEPFQLTSRHVQLRRDLAVAQVAEAKDGPAAAMPLLSGTYEALAEHRFSLISEPATAPWLVRVAVAAARPPLAERTTFVADEIARANPGFSTMTAAAEHARGILDVDPGRLKRAWMLHEDPWAGGSAAEDLGLLHLDREAREEAIACLDGALDCYQRADAGRDMARVRRRLRRMGVRRRHWKARRRPAVGWESLTETERAISELVCQGLSNHEVANRQYLSVHTVAFHLRQVFRKLGISSRVELARIATEQVRGGQASQLRTARLEDAGPCLARDAWANEGPAAERQPRGRGRRAAQCRRRQAPALPATPQFARRVKPLITAT